MLWLLRHAEAERGEPDPDRRLTARGKGDARIAGKALARLGARIDVCLASPKVRAAETARLACETLGVEVRLADALAGAPFDPYELADDHALLVGHDPSFSTAVHDLTGANVRLRKGGLAVVDNGELVVVLRPTELAAIANAKRA
jgi:phosphohistidine phosphatase